MKILVTLSRVPYPLDKGDKLRAYHLIKELNKTEDVKVVCVSDIKVKQEHEVILKSQFNIEIIYLNKALIYWNLFKALFSKKPFQVHYFYQSKAKRRIKQIVSDFKPDHIYAQLIRTTEYVKDIHETPKTLDYMDTFSAGIERRIKSYRGIKKQLFKTEAERLLKYENIIFEYFENKTIISEQDRDLIYHQNRNKIKVIRNGVDFNFFSPKINCDEIKGDILFTGNMNYPPNIDGAVYLVNEILPLLLAEKPTIKLIIAGVTPAKEVLALESENVTITGWIDDIRSAYKGTNIFVAPMRIGTGLQNKLLEAMAMNKPCVTTQLANNALKASDGNQIMIGNSAKEIAEQILLLLDDKEFAEKLRINGGDYVRENFSWKQSAENLLNVMR